MDPLTPNTSAFLSYLSTNLGTDISQEQLKNINPVSLAPSAVFPVPGRDTPEDTPPSSVDTSQSPEKPYLDNNSADSADEVADESRNQIAPNHKRKAGQGHQINEDEDEDEDGAFHLLAIIASMS